MAVVNNKIKDICTLTPLQEGMLFFNLMSKETGQYVIQNSFDTKFDLDVNLVKQTLDLVSLRYSVLRTFFLYENVKQNCQVVLKERTLEYDYQDWSDLGNQQQEELFADYLSKDLKRGFDLKEDTLLRVKHIRLGENKNRILFTMHHIIIDGWCVSTIFQKFFSYYLMLCNGEKYDEMVNKVKEEENSEGSYSEYIKWLNSKNKEDAKEYWKGLLEGYDSVCAIKSTQNRDGEGRRKGQRQKVSLARTVRVMGDTRWKKQKN